MTHVVGVSFDTEDRIVYVATFEENENGDMTIINEDAYCKDQWSLMDDDTWLREIPAINAELEANAFLAKLQVGVL
jgi:hypothetical protein